MCGRHPSSTGEPEPTPQSRTKDWNDGIGHRRHSDGGRVHAKQRRVPTVAADGCLGRMTRGTNFVPPSAVLFLSCRLCFSLFLALWRACRQSDWPNPCFLLPSVGQLLLLAIPFAVVGVEESPPKKASCGLPSYLRLIPLMSRA